MLFLPEKQAGDTNVSTCQHGTACGLRRNSIARSSMCPWADVTHAWPCWQGGHPTVSKAPPAGAPGRCRSACRRQAVPLRRPLASAQSSRVCMTPAATHASKQPAPCWRPAARRRAHLAGAALAGRSLAGLSGLSAAGAAGAGAPASIQLASTTSFTRRLYSRLSACSPLRGHRSLPPAVRPQHQSRKGPRRHQGSVNAHKGASRQGCAPESAQQRWAQRLHLANYTPVHIASDRERS